MLRHTLLLVSLVALHQPARAGDVPTARYVLDQASTYQFGCFEPCDCPILEPVPLTGQFRLISAGFDGPLERYQVADLAFAVPVLGRSFTGGGSYTRGGGQQSLVLELRSQDGTERIFDSGWIPADAPFPTIDVRIDFNDSYCYDEPMSLRADPIGGWQLRISVARDEIVWTEVADGSGYDVAAGDLTALRVGGGDFGKALPACLADGMPGLRLAHDGIPGTGGGWWFLVRAPGSQFASTYDSDGASQVAPRDPGLDVCP